MGAGPADRRRDRASAHFEAAPGPDVSPLAARLFAVDGVIGVFFASNFVTVTKRPDVEWTDIAQPLVDAIKASLADGRRRRSDPPTRPRSGADEGEVVGRIRPNPRGGGTPGGRHGRRRHRLRGLSRRHRGALHAGLAAAAARAPRRRSSSESKPGCGTRSQRCKESWLCRPEVGADPPAARVGSPEPAVGRSRSMIGGTPGRQNAGGRRPVRAGARSGSAAWPRARSAPRSPARPLRRVASRSRLARRTRSRPSRRAGRPSRAGRRGGSPCPGDRRRRRPGARRSGSSAAAPISSASGCRSRAPHWRCRSPARPEHAAAERPHGRLFERIARPDGDTAPPTPSSTRSTPQLTQHVFARARAARVDLGNVIVMEPGERRACSPTRRPTRSASRRRAAIRRRRSSR